MQRGRPARRRPQGVPRADRRPRPGRLAGEEALLSSGTARTPRSTSTITSSLRLRSSRRRLRRRARSPSCDDEPTSAADAASLPPAGKQAARRRGRTPSPGRPAAGKGRQPPRTCPRNPRTTRSCHAALTARRNLTVLAEKMDDPSKTLALIGTTLASLPEDHGRRRLLAIANQYARAGQWHLAREAYPAMADSYPRTRCPPTPTAGWSASSAAARPGVARSWASSSPSPTLAFTRPVTPKNSRPTRTTRSRSSTAPRPSATAGLTFLSDREETRHWYRGSLEIGKRLSAFGPLYASDPSIQFCLNAARRRWASSAPPPSGTRASATTPPRAPGRKPPPPKFGSPREAPPPKARPLPPQPRPSRFLDGDFDDPCWNGLKPLVLENAVGDTAKELPHRGPLRLR